MTRLMTAAGLLLISTAAGALIGEEAKQSLAALRASNDDRGVPGAQTEAKLSARAELAVPICAILGAALALLTL